MNRTSACLNTGFRGLNNNVKSNSMYVNTYLDHAVSTPGITQAHAADVTYANAAAVT